MFTEKSNNASHLVAIRIVKVQIIIGITIFKTFILSDKNLGISICFHLSIFEITNILFPLISPPKLNNYHFLTELAVLEI